MSIILQIAKHYREVHFGGNWSCSNLKDQLCDVTWQQATLQIHELNSIAMLTYHINYYGSAVIRVLQGMPLTGSDKYSFDCPTIESETDWQLLLDKMFSEAEMLACLIEQLPEQNLWYDLADEKYGNYYRNLHGIIEHCHYHLGQIVLIKKLIIKDTV